VHREMLRAIYDAEREAVTEHLVAIRRHREVMGSEDWQRLVKHDRNGKHCDEDELHESFHGKRRREHAG